MSEYYTYIKSDIHDLDLKNEINSFFEKCD